MEPISMMMMLGAGIGLQAIGGLMSHSGASDYNKAQQAEIGLEQQVQGQHFNAMKLDASRKKIENFREAQRAMAMSQAAATHQGAQYGSGYQGAQAQITNQGNWNELGVNQNLQIGENIFGINSQISQQKIQMAQAQQTMQTGAGITSFGNSLAGAAGPFGRLASGFGSGSKSYADPGGYS